jgi:hypothetical protein
MGQVRHGSATTTHAVRAAIQRSQASLAQLSRELGINPKTVAKWRKRATVEDKKTGPIEPRSTVLTEAEEAAIVAFRRHTLLPLDDCLYALQPSIQHLTRSALHRCLQRHGISRLPDVEGDKPKRQKFKRYPIGFFHIDIAEVQTAEGKLYLFVGIDRTAKFAVAQLVATADRKTAWEFLQHMLEAVPYQVHTILTDNVVADDGAGAAALGDHRVELAHHPCAGQRRIGDQRQAFAREVIDDRQNPEPPPVGEGIADEVEAPARVRGLRHRHRTSRSQGPFAPAALADLQSLFTV